MIKIGLTGNRYSGKDRVAKLFNQISIPVFEADIILKFILNHNFEVLFNIKKHIGTGLFKKDKKSAFSDDVYDIDVVKFVGGFNKLLDETERELLKAYEKFNLKHKESIYTIFHSSILYEGSWNKNMDYIISVFAPETERIDRCIRKDNTDIMKIYEFLSSEMSDLEKNSMSDFVIHNYKNNEMSDITTQVNKIDQKIIDKFVQNR